jgi:hypothetical protein
MALISFLLLLLKDHIPILKEYLLHLLPLVDVDGCKVGLDDLKSVVQLFEQRDDLVDQSGAGVKQFFFMGVLDIQA